MIYFRQRSYLQGKRLLSIKVKLFLAIVLPALVAVIALVSILQWNLRHGVDDYLNQRDRMVLQSAATKLAELYHQEGSWSEVFAHIQRGPLGPGPDGPPTGEDPLMPRMHPGPPILSMISLLGDLGPRTSIVDAQGLVYFGNPPRDPHDLVLPIGQGQPALGWIYLHPHPILQGAKEFDFLSTQTSVLLAVTLILLLTCALFAFRLSLHLLNPIQLLLKGNAELRQGNYSLQLTLERKDELGILIEDFNELARTLEQNRTLRTRWMADISHELRTPLTILRAELESMLDGVYPLNTQRVQLLRQDVLALSQLVEDMQQLTLSDQGALEYRKQDIDLLDILQQTVDRYRTRLQQNTLGIDLKIPNSPVILHVDPQRMEQLFGNLLENSWRYTHPGGRIQILVEPEKSEVCIRIDDSEPGVPDWALERLFERLFRIDRSRTRKDGGSGLGLSICQAIVQAHMGSIEVHHSPLGGLRVSIRLPYCKIS